MNQCDRLFEELTKDTVKTVNVLVGVFLRRVETMADKCKVTITSDLDSIKREALNNIGKKVKLNDLDLKKLGLLEDEEHRQSIFKEMFKESARSLLSNLRALQSHGKLSSNEIMSIMAPLLKIEVDK